MQGFLSFFFFANSSHFLYLILTSVTLNTSENSTDPQTHIYLFIEDHCFVTLKVWYVEYSRVTII